MTPSNPTHPPLIEGKKMRKNPTKRIEQYRVINGSMASTAGMGANGKFHIPSPDGVAMLCIIASEGEPDDPRFAWEHVSVSLGARCPTWEEMDYVKQIFWRDDETVMQLHVPRDCHINNHAYCLHLWKPINVPIPRPETVLVGVK